MAFARCARHGWCVLLALWMAVPAHGAATETFVPLSTSGWRLALYPGRIPTIPPEVFTSGYNDASWSPTSTPAGWVDGSCVNSVYYYWNTGYRTVVLRRQVVLPAGLSTVTIWLWAGASAYRVYLNDRLVSNGGSSTGCIGGVGSQLAHSYGTGTPDPWRAGSNSLVVVCETSGGARYLDVSVQGTIDPVPARSSTWGSIKALYQPGP